MLEIGKVIEPLWGFLIYAIYAMTRRLAGFDLGNYYVEYVCAALTVVLIGKALLASEAGKSKEEAGMIGFKTQTRYGPSPCARRVGRAPSKGEGLDPGHAFYHTRSLKLLCKRHVILRSRRSPRRRGRICPKCSMHPSATGASGPASQ